MKPGYVSITLRSEKEKNKHCKQTTQDKSKKTGKKKTKKMKIPLFWVFETQI